MVPRTRGRLVARRSSQDKRTRPSSVTPRFHVSRAASSLSRARTALARSFRGSSARAASAQPSAVGRSIAGRVASFNLAATSGGRRIHATTASSRTTTIVTTTPGTARVEPSERARAAGVEARVEGYCGDAEAGCRQDPVGGNVRPEVERAVHEKREHGPHRPDGDPDTEGIVTARALFFSAPDRTAGPTEQMRAQEISADTPDHEEHGHRADDSQLHEELQEVVVGHAHVDLAGLEHRWLVVPVDVSVCAETDAQQGKGSEHRECREGEHPAARVVRVPHASEEGLEPDPDGVAEGDHDKRADDREAPANSTEPAQQAEEDDE